ncbi:MAG: hypothetical protein WDO18_11015 [Acidobacteriota bacterium]
MTVSFRVHPWKPILLWVQVLLLAVGVLLLAYYAFVFFEAQGFQRQQVRQLEIAKPLLTTPPSVPAD